MAGQTVALRLTEPIWTGLDPGAVMVVEDWWDRVSGQSWKVARSNPAAIVYAIRTAFMRQSIPDDDEVVYGRVGGIGYLFHVTELGEAV